MTADAAPIRVGIGGWTFDAWNETFYPPEVKKKDQLEYAASKLRTIEINGTYYRGQKPETFAKWAAATPDGFVFSVKGSRFVTNRRVLAEAGESMAKFFATGVTELGDRLGPILWQLAPTKKFDADDFAAFLDLLPKRHDGVHLRHAVEVRHESFNTPEAVGIARARGVAIVAALHETYPAIWDVTADLVYVRLQTGSDDIETCYGGNELAAWTERLRQWSGGGAPDDLPLVDPENPAENRPREVFCYLIGSGKSRAPAGAMALQARIDGATDEERDR